MNKPQRWFRRCLLITAWGIGEVAAHGAPIPLAPTWAVNEYNNPAPNGVHVTLTGQSASGYTYSGTGTGGLPGTTSPDSRRRPKVFQDFSAFNAGGIGSTLSLTYDIKWNGNVNPTNQNAAWRFGFISSTANGGKGVTLGADLDIGNLAGTVFDEFFTDTSVTSGEAGSGVMDNAFTETLNAASDGIARIAQSVAVPPGNNVAFNDRVKTHRVILTLEKILDGYNLGFTWQNLAVGGTTVSNSTSITTSDFDPSVALAAGITSWDRIGFFVNADVVSGTEPWAYTLSNMSVDGVAIPEPACIGLTAIAMFAIGCGSRRRVNGRFAG